MGVWKLTAGLILIVVILNKVQALEVLPKESSGLEPNLFPDFRQSQNKNNAKDKEIKKLRNDFQQCAMEYLATVGFSCIDISSARMEFDELVVFYTGDAYGKELKKIYSRVCQANLICLDGECKCEDSSDIASCKPTIPKQDMTSNCDSQSQALVRSLRQRAALKGVTGPGIGITPRSVGSIVSDPGQHFQYIMLLAIILLSVAATN